MFQNATVRVFDSANGVDWAMAEADSDYIHHVVDELAGFLAAAAALQSPDRNTAR